MPTQYDAQIRKLDLPEQEALTNKGERCSADPDMLKSIGRDVGHQVRITRADNPKLFALYTVAHANPPADIGADPSRVRTGSTGRKRLSTDVDPPDDMNVVVRAMVVDADQPTSGARFFEVVGDDNPTQTYFIAIAPHGGDIEPRTDKQAELLRSELGSYGHPATSWVCKGFGDPEDLKGASERWHITSTDLNPACFPQLSGIATRKFSHGVAFHGFSQGAEDADVYIGGGASDSVKRAIEKAIWKELVAADLCLQIKIATDDDDPKFQGRKPANLINRLAVQGIHIEQSSKAREFGEKIAKAIATVYLP